MTQCRPLSTGPVSNPFALGDGMSVVTGTASVLPPIYPVETSISSELPFLDAKKTRL
jgi:hypothetical protein